MFLEQDFIEVNYAKIDNSGESARPLLSQGHKLIGTIGSLYVFQREYAVVTPHDNSTTTCCSVVVRHSGSGVVSVGHFDGSGVQEGVSDMVTKVQQFSSLLGGHGVLEVHIAGGFLDRRGYSEDLAVQLLLAFHRQIVNIHLVTFCVCNVNNLFKGSANYPIVCGVSVNVKTGEIFPSTFTERGPESTLRGARLLTGGSHEMLDMYETQIGVAKIDPFNYEPMRGIDLWLNEGDDFILQQNPFPSVTVFAESRPLYFRKDEYGQWIAI
ncbi:protein N-terminal asparagine amidohydrolase-like protein [Leptotrombidium deliense]|uniref:Protein N-terminal asparagine amidohydrolase-like protein n=1 Tax=Leptotrombidium deliense TaxID=299467 RepID=A0A443SH61_9ACAR|nr:protein N-terminal asparagine amidohydrolase-like protein [Leptotrombidium deliense]